MTLQQHIHITIMCTPATGDVTTISSKQHGDDATHLSHIHFASLARRNNRILIEDIMNSRIYIKHEYMLYRPYHRYRSKHGVLMGVCICDGLRD